MTFLQKISKIIFGLSVPFLILILPFLGLGVNGTRPGDSFKWLILYYSSSSILLFVLRIMYKKDLKKIENYRLYMTELIVLLIVTIVLVFSPLWMYLSVDKLSEIRLTSEVEKMTDVFLIKNKKLTDDEISKFLRSIKDQHFSSANVDKTSSSFEKLIEEDLIDPNYIFDTEGYFLTYLFLTSTNDYDIRYSEILLKNGGDPNSVRKFRNQTALINLSSGSQITKEEYEKIKLLLFYGADAEIKDEDGMNARDYLLRQK